MYTLACMHLSVRLTGFITLCLSNHSINCSCMSRVVRFSDRLSNTRNSEIIRKRYQQTVRKKQTRVFARPPNTFLIHAVTESCTRVSSAAVSKAEGEQKLTATLGSIWHKKTQTTGHLFEAGGKSGQIPISKKPKTGAHYFGLWLAQLWEEFWAQTLEEMSVYYQVSHWLGGPVS